VSFIRRAWELLKRIYRAARDERASPKEIGWAVGVGVFVGCSPVLGFHGAIALGLATILRKNRLYCWLGSRVCNVVTLPFVAVAEVEVARLLRTGHFVTLDRDHILEQAPALFGDWLLGMLPVGSVLALLIGAAVYLFSRYREERTNRKLAIAEDLSHNPPHERSES
jgi:uncharacterized protein (DUF2062 family)